MTKGRNRSGNQENIRHANRVKMQEERSAGRGKRNQQQVVEDRWAKKDVNGRVISEKFKESVEEQINKTPLIPQNQQQAEYIHNIKTKPFNIAVGYAGTSKTYIPTRIAIEKYLRGEIDKIVLVRPAISDSKSLGFYGGDLIQKSKNWLLPIMDILDEFLGKSRVEYMLAKGDILPVPLELIKGRSFKNCFVIVDEAEDLSKKEFIKCITRLGTGSYMTFAGDLRQVDIKNGSGLDFGLDLADDEELYDIWGVVDFDDPEEIVRSKHVKRTIIRLTEMGEM